jgi:hypothetical protein
VNFSTPVRSIFEYNITSAACEAARPTAIKCRFLCFIEIVTKGHARSSLLNIILAPVVAQFLFAVVENWSPELSVCLHSTALQIIKFRHCEIEWLLHVN